MIFPLLLIAQFEQTALDHNADFKTRVMAISKMSLSRDPGALGPLKRLLLDEGESDEIRSTAAAGIPSLDVSRQAQRQPLCAALRQKALPRQTRDAALVAVSNLGCDDSADLERIAGQFGSRPAAGHRRAIGYAVQALGQSHFQQSSHALLRFLTYFDPGSDEKTVVLAALLHKGKELMFLDPPTAADIRATLLMESRYPANATLALRLLAATEDRGAASLILRFLKNKDAEIATEAAETLADLRISRAKTKIKRQI